MRKSKYSCSDGLGRRKGKHKDAARCLQARGLSCASPKLHLACVFYDITRFVRAILRALLVASSHGFTTREGRKLSTAEPLRAPRPILYGNEHVVFSCEWSFREAQLE